ncbi:cytochrome b-c1 complex subunit 9 [Anthonomus grandis grandis]|uniref:cytochrome b-c1 complex subunit 9 n=1 Tax=Anthonomus grandis grandis TaxID=2921223 RepID=UPI00216581AD|nr:cytochrome b-c1 complex subunit 9 [Anthonomus grandis grandis]
MSFQHTIYNAIFKRSSTFALVCIGSAFFFERGLDLACDTIFENVNKGKLWKDIKDNYAQ